MRARPIPFLMKAYRWRTRKSDAPAVEEAYSLLGPAAFAVREVLNALLICPTVTLEEIAGHLSLPREVVIAYEALFFNVRDRLEEKFFLGQLCFPGTRLAAMGGSATALSRAQRLLQAALDYGAEDVLHLVGILSHAEGPDTDHLKRVLEQSLIQKSKDLVRYGDQEPKEILTTARMLLAMSKRFGGAKPSAHNGPSMSESIMAELLARDDSSTGSSGGHGMIDMARIDAENAHLLAQTKG
jgi:hypothetical protein